MPGDIYSFGIILHEILEQHGLFYTGLITEYCIEEKIQFVSLRQKTRQQTTLEPGINDASLPECLIRGILKQRNKRRNTKRIHKCLLSQFSTFAGRFVAVLECSIIAISFTVGLNFFHHSNNCFHRKSNSFLYRCISIHYPL